ncbi:hypothetical protein BB560_003548 [Smittium megazygosporum]|uniref:CWF21 domain-containing protein n=1 Tax=Smittium megazygosporum TaxID=133381 RepID=A0A2T9ZBP4_9FUNG|nr:hypothetical protein BB560_003548 [Smittium megazygosporum]
MYNGIGLTTPRGTGTSGYVVKNLSTLNKKPHRQQNSQLAKPHDPDVAGSGSLGRRVDLGILEHEKKRQIEVKLLYFQDELEEQGLSQEEIEKQVDDYRANLMQQLDSGSGKLLDEEPTERIRSETHLLLEAKKKETEKFAAALKIDKTYVEGMAFDKELVELKKQQKRFEYEEKALREKQKALEALKERERSRRYKNRTKEDSSSSDSSISSSDSYSSSSHEKTKSKTKDVPKLEKDVRSQQVDKLSGSSKSRHDSATSDKSYETTKTSSRKYDSSSQSSEEDSSRKSSRDYDRHSHKRKYSRESSSTHSKYKYRHK